MVSKVYIFLIFMVLILPSLGLTRYLPPPCLAPVTLRARFLPSILEVLKSKRRVNKTYAGLPWWGGANPSCVYLVEGSAS